MAKDFLAALKSGAFDEAYALVVAAVKAKPGCADTRAHLATLLCYLNEYERAEKQLETILSLDPGYATTVNTWRHLLTAAHQRQHTFSTGDAPCLVGAPTPNITRALKLLLAQRTGLAPNELAQLTDMIEHSAQRLPQVILGDDPTADWQDLDDRFWNIVEVLGGNGKYYWFDISQIASIEFEQPTTLLERLWLPAKVILNSGETGHVSIPTIYPSFGDPSAPQGSQNDLASQYGQKTDWSALRCLVNQETDAAFENLQLTQGEGLRTWLLGDESRPIFDFAGRQMRPVVVTDENTA